MGQKQLVSEKDLPESHGLAVLGHELGNVLHGLLGMAELLGESSLTAEQCRWLRAIEYSGQQMVALIQSAWSREPSATARIVPRPNRVDGIELLEHVVTSHTPAARSGKNRLILLVDPDMPRSWCLDACLVRQLLDNLVGNANKFTRAGQIVIEAATIRATGGRDRAIRLRVIDSGSGFEATAIEQLFGAYRRFNDSAESATGDRGLGLYICHNIAEAMNGQLSGACAEDGGTFFEVVLPCFSDGTPARSPEFHSELLDQLHCRLDLDGVLRKSVENFLKRLGVRFGEKGCAKKPADGQLLELHVSERQEPGVVQPCLLFTAHSKSGARVWQKNLQAPLLESSLGRLLLESAFEWRSRLLRNGSRDSVPKRR